MPLNGERLIVEPRFPHAETLMNLGAEVRDDRDDEFDGAKVINRFWSTKKSSDIVIFELKDGRRDWGVIPGVHHLPMDLRTLGCQDAWGIEQEAAAVQTLAGLLPHRQFKQYMLTGMFLESSKRSGVHYLFRRLKPTVAISGATGTLKILGALCLHPIGYYAQGWAGAMCPTDDVIAHLMLMRGDEHMFWRRANQHAPWRPESGL